jgi:serine/threonine protein kinase
MHQSGRHTIGEFSYEDKDFLGQGSYGRVYKGKNTRTGDIVAIKSKVTSWKND